MSCFRVLLAIIFPPLAVVDKGCGSFLITFILTCCGWVQGYNQASRQQLYGNQPPSNHNRQGGWQGW